MGNKKNNKNHSNHRHVYKKKRNPFKYKKSSCTQLTRQSRNSQSPPPTLQGSRIINLDKLQKYSSDLTAHSLRCDGTVTLTGEKRQGLASILSGHCSVCDIEIILETSSKVKGARGYRQWECNLGAIWAEMSTGGGHSRLEETLSVLGVPVMTKSRFISTERGIGEQWRKILEESMAEAGRQEKQLAIERGDFHEDVPAITVIVDGGWSKRSHKHYYNAKSGVGIIIGKETKKLLYLGVRNKYCAACTQGSS